MNIIERKLGIEVPAGAKQWFTVSWFLFAVVGVPSYVLGHFEFGHVLSGTLMFLDCLVIAWVLMHRSRHSHRALATQAS